MCHHRRHANMLCESTVSALSSVLVKHACVARLCISLSSCPPLPAYCRADPETGGSPEHVFDTMVMELDQRLEKVGARWEEVLCYQCRLS